MTSRTCAGARPGISQDMAHLPTWTVLIAAVPLVIAGYERRQGRARHRLERIAFAAAVGLTVWAAAAFPADFVGAVWITVLVGAWGAATLAAGAFLESLPALARRSSARARRGRRRGETPARRPHTAPRHVSSLR